MITSIGVFFSRGEKYLLLLFLAVKSTNSDSTIFLVDEPEQALHIEWQANLTKLFDEIAPDSAFIIGTHAPSIIGETKSEIVINLASL